MNKYKKTMFRLERVLQSVLAWVLFIIFIIITSIGAILYFNLSDSLVNIKNQDWFNPMKNIFEICSAYLTPIAVFFAAVSIRSTLSTSEASFIYEADNHYGTCEMLASLRVLKKFKKEHAPGSGSSWVLEDKYRTDKNNPQGRIQVKTFKIPSKVNKARRQVKFYFKSLYALYVHGKISEKVLKIILDKSGIRFFFEVVEPLESCLNPDYDYKPFYDLMCLSKSHYKKHSMSNINDYLIEDNELPSGESEAAPVSEPVVKSENAPRGKGAYKPRTTGGRGRGAMVHSSSSSAASRNSSSKSP